jgi:hypothetical protein
MTADSVSQAIEAGLNSVALYRKLAQSFRDQAATAKDGYVVLRAEELYQIARTFDIVADGQILLGAQLKFSHSKGGP